MREFLKKLFNKSGEEGPLTFEFNGNISFTLKIDDVLVGTLSLKDKLWLFQYSEEFKTQEEYRRLAGFSDLNKVYSSEVLWPFFKIRIPGLKQPMVKEILERENLNSLDEAQLLKRFGKISMSNPYILEVS